MLKIFCVGAGFDGSTNLERIQALEKAGAEVAHLDSGPWVKTPPAWWRRLHYSFGFGPLSRSFNKRILEVAQVCRPDVVWIDKGRMVCRNTLRSLHAQGILTVHYSPDPAVVLHRSRIFEKAVPQYDLLITSKPWEVDAYKQKGARDVLITVQGTDPAAKRPMPLDEAEERIFGSELVFVGHAEEHYIQTIRSIINRLPELKIKIWGKWGRAVERFPELKHCWQGGGVYGDDYARALSGAGIALGLLSKLIPETETTRSFEIPACGTMLLAERTTSHQALYEEGREAEFFADVDEAVEKISYYLNHPESLARVARAGRERFLKSDYTTDGAMQKCLEVIRAKLRT